MLKFWVGVYNEKDEPEIEGFLKLGYLNQQIKYMKFIFYKFFHLYTLLLFLFLVTFNHSILPQSALENEEILNTQQSIQSFIQNARLIEPELAADIFLKLVRENKISDNEKKLELLKDAFYLAHSSKEKVRRKSIYKSRRVLTNRTTFIENSQRYGLNRLSLQTSIVSEISKIDPQLGFDMFGEIFVDDLHTQLDCNDDLTFDPSDLYKVTAEISKTAFDKQDLDENRRMLFLSSYINKFVSHSQVLPALEMLSHLNLREDEKAYLTSVFSRSINGIKAEDPSFSLTVNYENAATEMARYSYSLHGSEAVHDEYVNALRHYLVSNLSRSRCEHNINLENAEARNKTGTENASANETYLPIYLKDLNKTLFAEKPISPDDIKPESIVRSDNSVQIQANNEFDRMYQEKLGKLSYWKDEQPTTDEQKASYEWQSEFSKTLDAIAEIKPTSSIDTMETFHRKCLLYRLIFRIHTDVKLRSRVINSYAALLGDNSIRRESIAEWFMEFDNIRIEIKRDNGDKEELFEVLRRANIDAVNLYLDLDEVLIETMKEPNLVDK